MKTIYHHKLTSSTLGVLGDTPEGLATYSQADYYYFCSLVEEDN